MAKKWITTFTVESRRPTGIFPVDMLRYDYCTSASEEESGNMMFSLTGHYSEDSPPVRLHHIEYGNKNWKPTRKRWESFGWVVTKVEAPRELN